MPPYFFSFLFSFYYYLCYYYYCWSDFCCYYTPPSVLVLVPIFRSSSAPVLLPHPSNPSLPSLSSNSRIVPASVKIIADRAFLGCASLTTVTIETGSALLTIGIDAFGATALTAFVGMCMNTNAPRHARRCCVMFWFASFPITAAAIAAAIAAATIPHSLYLSLSLSSRLPQYPFLSRIHLTPLCPHPLLIHA